jgi:hypothetical protein
MLFRKYVQGGEGVLAAYWPSGACSHFSFAPNFFKCRQMLKELVRMELSDFSWCRTSIAATSYICADEHRHVIQGKTGKRNPALIDGVHWFFSVWSSPPPSSSCRMAWAPRQWFKP